MISEARFETFGSRNVVSQVRRAHELACNNAGWLQESHYAGAHRRYGQGVLKAMKNVHRLTPRTPEAVLHPGLLQYRRHPDEKLATVGLATVIRRQGVVHSESQILFGTNVDYWLDAAYDPEYDVHEAVAAAVLQKVAELDSDTPTDVFATISPNADQQPEGFRSYLERQSDEPVKLSMMPIPDRENEADIFDITRSGSPQELYARVLQRNPLLET